MDLVRSGLVVSASVVGTSEDGGRSCDKRARVALPFSLVGLWLSVLPSLLLMRQQDKGRQFERTTLEW